ncbi:DUF2892 domain-containing protein [candidate division KSB1 bacterium]|nr:DUF2892 domain-containing protein [candidate division KSB1 bacterium]
MQKNVGKTDQLIRLIVGGVIIILGLVYQNWWGLIGLIPVVTGILSYCPLYTLLGISTCAVKKN